MGLENRRISPFVIQCFVTAGVSLNMANLGLVMGFVTSLLPQLRDPDSNIIIDDSSASWIASLPGITIIAGNLITPCIMSTLGRRISNLTSLAVSAIGWICIVVSNSVSILILARIVQGIGLGMISSLGPVLIGEYTSPKNRGMFLMSISMIVSMGVFAIQTMGEYLPWKMCALICIGIALFNAVIIIFSPESPTFLVDKERYDECRKVFIYLRGDTENEELEKMIATRILSKKEQEDEKKSLKEKMSSKLVYLKETLKKKEFYKPIIIMSHVFVMAHWSGVNVISSFTNDLFEKVIGVDSGINIPLMIVILGAHRIIANILGIVIIKTMRRRVVLFSAITINIVALLAIAAYAYTNDNNLLPFDKPIIGIMLIHMLLFSIAIGAIPLAYVLAGELYPMEYRGLCGGISMVFFSLNLFGALKTVLLLFNNWGIYGAFCLYAAITVYCLIVVGVLLPETKDRTLQDIEEEFRGKKISDK